MKNIIIALSLLYLMSANKVLGQESIRASVHDIIQSAQEGSPDYLLAKIRAENAKWRYVAAQAVFKPQLGLSATLPQVNRTISSVTLPTGQEFFNNSFMTNSIGLTLSQVVGATGGSVFASSRIERLDLFKTDSQDANTKYLSAPISIGFNQPLLRHNPYKWDKQQADLTFQSSQKKFVEDRESIAFAAVNNFFDLYTAKLSLDEARLNLQYLDSIATNAKGRFEVGRISETDLLQIQLSSKNADGNVARLALEVQNKTETLRDFLGISNEVEFDLSAPDPITIYAVDKDIALEYANKNRSQTEEFRMRLLDAQKQVDIAQKDNGPNMRLTGSFGLTNSGNTIDQAYGSLLDQQGVSLSIDVPIADFGRAKAQRQIAKSNLELTQLQVQQDRISFERTILVTVEQFELKRDQLQLSEEALEIALKRLDIAKKRYQIGKVTVTDLNIAIQEEQSARQRYFSTLWDLWRTHYTIRNLTLFDFESGVVIE